MSYVTSDTVAYFDSKNKNVSTIMISAGTWEDEPDEIESDETEDDDEEKAEAEDTSSLAFVKQELPHPQTCPTEIEVEVTNEGDGSMLTNAFYEVYFIEEGNPEKDGEKVTLEEHEGVIEILENGATQKLVYETSKPGFYQFVMDPHEKTSEDERIWSDVIEVLCEEKPDENTEEKEEPKEEINDEENTEESTTTSDEVVDDEATEEDINEQKNDDEKNPKFTESDTEKDAAATKEKDVEGDEKKENNEVDE